MEFANIFIHFLVLIQSGAVFSEGSCGSSVKATGLIIRGNFSEQNQWPWLAALMTRSDGVFFCGGTLISKLHVLTAAHCIQPKKQPVPITFDEFVVYLGKHNLSVAEEYGSKRTDPSRVLLHSDWNYRSERYDADIAIIFAEDEIGITLKIAPVCVSNTLSIHKKGTVVDICSSETVFLQII